MAYPEGVIFEDDPDYDHSGYGSYDDDYPDRDDDPGFYADGSDDGDRCDDDGREDDNFYDCYHDGG